MSVAIAMAFAVTPAHAATWTSCGHMKVTHKPSGLRFAITSIKTNRVTCKTARSVIRDFYAQTIGSSGATEAKGFGCAYNRSRGVSCRSRTGNSYNGNKRIRWIERDA
jgi:hypothetical protein